MASSSVANIRIAGLAAAVPSKSEGIAEASARFGEEVAKKVAAATGIQARRVAPAGVCTSDLCYTAAMALLQQLGRDKESIGGLIFVSQTPDYYLPATSHLLQERLGLRDDVFALDINLGCSGYVYGLWLAAVTASNTGKSVLLAVGDTMTSLTGQEDQSTAMLFGDAGTATLVDPAIDSPPMFFHFGADGSGAEHLITPVGGFRKRPDETTRLRREGIDGNSRSQEELYMNGAEVFAFTIRRVPPMVRSVLESASLTMDNVDAVVLHQANAFMLEHLRKKMKIPADKFVVCFAEYGNTSSASIPLAIAASPLIQAKSQSGAPLRLLLGGFGVGLSWGAALVDFAGAQLLPVLECGDEIAGTLETSICS